VTVSRLSGSQKPESISITASSHASSTWAASFAHTEEQANHLAGKAEAFDLWRRPTTTVSSEPVDLTLEEEAEKQIKKRKEGIVHFSHRYGSEPNATVLDTELDEQRVLVNLTLCVLVSRACFTAADISQSRASLPDSKHDLHFHLLSPPYHHQDSRRTKRHPRSHSLPPTLRPRRPRSVDLQPLAAHRQALGIPRPE
jgi:hypothetical protein